MIISFFRIFLTVNFIFLFGLSACKSGENKIGHEKQNEKLAESEMAKIDKTTCEKLQGRWMSLDDAGSVIEFKGSTKIEYYNDQIVSTANFEILEKCKSGFSTSDVEGEYIDDGEICHKIEEVTEQTLMLIYMDRGNLLRYKRL